MSLWSDLVTRLTNAKSAIATAISNKGTTVPDGSGFESFAALIDSISTGADTSGVTATAADVLTGKVIIDASGNQVTGTMTNNGAVSKTLTPSTSAVSYTIPKGYHNGSGKVTASAIKPYATGTFSGILTQTPSINTGVTLKSSDIFIILPDYTCTENNRFVVTGYVGAVIATGSNFRICVSVSNGLMTYKYDNMSVNYNEQTVNINAGDYLFYTGIYRWALLR